MTFSELLLKLGASETAHFAGQWGWTGISGLASPLVWFGILLIIASFFTWLHVLRYIPLGVAFPLSNLVYVLVPLCSWLFLGERIGPIRWCGIALVLIGLVIVARPVARLEERI